ncbi:tetratricopeptide repeat protein [Lichenicola cladoniae]|uniref:Tetratricopeptide repeat protein n=1 Tax=Lichenicola cladoniae TaxID=1484109 RepID=A0A6M8HHC1_9PROT|nr:tetratricopeptide repeat protein [Lichenicola cladoniae]NPD69195.1 tetratricopeptide repeat protein [Acetobacteraceae bacterium]QKE89022.1 tetratricopeptide repeat protein [Lichenicola cladoniae]
MVSPMSYFRFRPLASSCVFLGMLALTGCANGGRQPAAGRLGLGLADSALAGGAPSLALQVSKAVLARNPNDVPALLRRGDAYYQLGDYPRAAASYRQALTLHVRSVPALMGLGRVALATSPAEASARFSEVLALEPTNQAAMSNRGVALDLSGLHAEAQDDYRRAIALAHADAARGIEVGADSGALAATQVDLAVSMAISGQPAAAVRILQPIASSPDASPRVRQDLAMALALDDRADDAARLLLTQMSQSQARSAMSGYQALREDATPPPPPPGDGS